PARGAGLCRVPGRSRGHPPRRQRSGGAQPAPQRRGRLLSQPRPLPSRDRRTPLATLELAGAFETLPPGVAGIVTGVGEEAGEALVTHRQVDMVAFTGATAAAAMMAIE